MNISRVTEMFSQSIANKKENELSAEQMMTRELYVEMLQMEHELNAAKDMAQELKILKSQSPLEESPPHPLPPGL